MDHEKLGLLFLGLESHGFREDTEPCWPGFRRFRRQGREDRWVRESDSRLFIGPVAQRGSWLAYGTLEEPDSQVALLMKCGEILRRTRERAEARAERSRKPQKELFDGDAALKQLEAL